MRCSPPPSTATTTSCVPYRLLDTGTAHIRKNTYIGKAACGLYGTILDIATGGPEENSCAVLGSGSTTFSGVKWRLTGNAFIAKIVGSERQALKVVGGHWTVGCALFIELWNQWQDLSFEIEITSSPSGEQSVIGTTKRACLICSCNLEGPDVWCGILRMSPIGSVKNLSVATRY